MLTIKHAHRSLFILLFRTSKSLLFVCPIAPISTTHGHMLPYNNTLILSSPSPFLSPPPPLSICQPSQPGQLRQQSSMEDLGCVPRG